MRKAKFIFLVFLEQLWVTCLRVELTIKLVIPNYFQRQFLILFFVIVLPGFNIYRK